MKKVIFITGASTGIGRETAVYFSKKGWNVAATMRSPEKGKDLLQHPNIAIFAVDVLDSNSIKKAIDAVLIKFGNIDVLFNNAGYGLVGAFEAMTQEQIKKQFDTNIFGVMNVTRSILPYFRSKNSGVIINTSSMGGIITFPLYSVYHATKWALEGFAESLQYELRPFNIKVKNIEPGAIKTEFETAIEFVSISAYDRYTKPVHQTMLDTYKTAPGPQVVAKKVWQAASDGSYRLRYPVGGQGPLLLFMRWLLPLSWFMAMVRSQVEKRI